MYYVCKPAKIQIYVNTGRKTTAQIKRETGCDIIINGGIYDMNKYIPYCWLKVDGKILHAEAWHRPGYGWDNNILVYDRSENIAKYRNYIQCVELPSNLNEKPSYPAEMGGRRGRTAIGVRADGQVVVYCTKDGSSYAATPEQLQTEMAGLGCVSALMLDGGLSSQCIMPNGTITSTRDGGAVAIHNYILIWIAKEVTQPPQNTQTPAQTPTPAPVCTDGTKAECKYRPPCGYCAKYYKRCPLVE